MPRDTKAFTTKFNAEGSNDESIQASKYVEVQIVGDHHGNYATLLEGDCSIQRRNQKVIEKAQCTFLPPIKRKEIKNLALKAPKIM